MSKTKEKVIDATEADVQIEDAPETTDLVSMAQITVTQLPVIEERLRDVKAAVEATVAEAKSLVATADTVQAVKARRAELNKQFNAIEDQRKAIKEQIAAPYQRFEKVYRECIAGPFKEADAALKATVDDFQNAVKKVALDKLESYYYELCALDQIDWLTFQDALVKSNIKISMEDCKKKEPRKAMDELAAFTSKIGLGLDSVRQMDDSAEIMVEFKKCLDAGQAAAIVQERKRKVREAAEAENRRKEEAARQQEMVAKVEAAAPAPAPVAAPTAAPTPVADPTQAERVFPEFQFTVYNCTRSQLIKIRDYLKQEGIQYA